MVKEISGLKREVKRAKLFEIQHMVRRIRQLANKKGTEAQLKKNQRKVERFEKEMEFLKDVEVAEIIRRIKSKEEDHDGHVDQELEVSQENIDLQKRAIDRIINSTKLQEFLEKIAAEEKDSVESEQRSGEADTVPIKKKQPKNVKDKIAKSFASSEPQAKEEDEDNSSSDEKVLRQQKVPKEKATIKTRLTSGIDPDLEEFEDDNVYSPSSDLSESDEGEDSDDISSLGIKPKGLESCFVQTMSGLKKETSNGKSKQGKGKRKEANEKGKKNRKGQRARQQMWQKIHGKSAKHLHKKKKTELSSKESKEPKKKQENEKTQNAIKRKDDNEMLHPSWEATKRRRLQESTKVEFKGEKIRFDDSE